MSAAAETRVRPATSADAASIAAIYRPIVEQTTVSFEFEAPDAVEIARRIADVTARGFPFLVAERDGRVVGYAYATTFRARPAYDGTAESSVYVDENARGSGVGQALMRTLIEKLRSHGLRALVAGVTVDPATPAASRASIALHEALGFREVGRFRGIGRKFDRSLDVLFLQRPL